MQIRTESSVTYKEGFDGERNVLNLTNDGKASDNALEINLSVNHTDFSDNWNIVIELKKEFSVSLWFNVVFSIDDCKEDAGSHSGVPS